MLSEIREEENIVIMINLDSGKWSIRIDRNGKTRKVNEYGKTTNYWYKYRLFRNTAWNVLINI